MKGERLQVGQYWAGGVSAISVRAKVLGGPRGTSFVVRETVLTDAEPIAVTRWLNDGEKPEDWKPSAKRGDQVVIRISGMEMVQGAVVLQGKIEPLV